jgi:hypothetical protein
MLAMLRVHWLPIHMLQFVLYSTLVRATASMCALRAHCVTIIAIITRTNILA